MAATQLCPTLVFQGVTATGAPLVGGQLFSYAAGTSTPQATYVDSTFTTQNTNPVILNSLGQANVWLNPALGYKFVLQDSAGNPIYTVDNILGAIGPPNVVIGPPASGVALTVVGNVVVSGATSGASLLVSTATNGASAIVAAGQGISANPVVGITNANVAGQSNGLVIAAGANAADLPLNIQSAALTTIMTVNGLGAVTVGGVAAQTTGSVNCSGGYYINNVRQPIFAAPLAGFGTPTGAAVVANFPGASATLVQCSNAIAQILTTLKAAQIYAA